MVFMGYFSMIGLLFVPLVLLLCTGWFFVRWQNEHNDDAQREWNKKICKRLLIAFVAALIVFFALHMLFPLVV